MEFSQTWRFRKTRDDFPGRMESYFTNLEFPELRGLSPFPLLFTTHLGDFGRAKLFFKVGQRDELFKGIR